MLGIEVHSFKVVKVGQPWFKQSLKPLTIIRNYSPLLLLITYSQDGFPAMYPSWPCDSWYGPRPFQLWHPCYGKPCLGDSLVPTILVFCPVSHRGGVLCIGKGKKTVEICGRRSVEMTLCFIWTLKPSNWSQVQNTDISVCVAVEIDS